MGNPIEIEEADTEGKVEDLIADMGWDCGLFDGWDDEDQDN